VITFYGWFSLGLRDCGCFGNIYIRSPLEEIITNLMLVAFLMLSYKMMQTKPSISKLKSIFAVVILLSTSLIIIAWRKMPEKAVAYQHLEVGQSLGHLPVRDIDVDLRKGVYLLVFMRTGCPHCQNIVPTINQLKENSAVPEIVAISADIPQSREQFKQTFHPNYPIGYLDIDYFTAILHRVPTFVLLENGTIGRLWRNINVVKDFFQRKMNQFTNHEF